MSDSPLASSTHQQGRNNPFLLLTHCKKEITKRRERKQHSGRKKPEHALSRQQSTVLP